ncbi:MAG TPA: type II CAAX endopeptidase family protein, partial [Actinomycetota bacterium]|nr:type II CAAX endopeptidase family protein [Actinomycetota bacterium]
MDLVRLHARWAGLPRAWLPVKVVAALALVYGAGTLGGLLPGYAVATTAVVLAYLSFAARRGRVPADVGLGRAGAVRETAAGFALGAALMGLVVAVHVAAGWYRVLRTDVEPWTLAASIVFFALVSVQEEVVARGVMFRAVERRWGSGAALVVSSLVFGFLHAGNPSATWWSSVAIAVEAGILLGGAYMVTRSLWLPIGIHWSWNLVQGPVAGLPVSGQRTRSLLVAEVDGPQLWTGGAFGPEAGLVAFAIGTAVGLAL